MRNGQAKLSQKGSVVEKSKFLYLYVQVKASKYTLYEVLSSGLLPTSLATYVG